MKNELAKIITDNEAIKEAAYSFIGERIKKIVGDKELLFSIEDLHVKEYPSIEINLLIDRRTIIEDTEFNKQNVPLRRKINENDISVFDYTLKNCSFSDIGKKTSFRVENTENTFSCSKCNGKKEITCGRCVGSGKNRCSKCNGQGQIKCNTCNGRGENRCFSCSGTGRKTEGSGDNKRTVNCSSCGGKGFKKCTNCNNGWNTCGTCKGKGEVPCPNCYSKGLVKCKECEGYGYFNNYLNVVSKIEVENISQYLKGNPTLDYLCITKDKIESDYTGDFLYDMKELDDYAINFKSLLTGYHEINNSKTLKIIFSKSLCYTVEFNVLIAQTKFKFEYSSDDFVTSTNFDSSVFYSIISSIQLENDFGSLKKNKKYLISKIGKPVNNLFEQIKEYELLKKIIASNENNSTKLNEIRKLKLVNISKYDNFLQNKLIKSYILLSIVLTLGLFVGLLFFNGLLLIPSLISIIGMGLGFFLSYKYFVNKIKHSSYKSSLSLALIILISSSLLTGLIGYITVQAQNNLVKNELKMIEVEKNVSETNTAFNQLKKKGVIIQSDSIILINGNNLKFSLYFKNPSKTSGHKSPDSVLVLEASPNTKEFVFYLPAGWEHYGCGGYRYKDGELEPIGEFKIRKSKKDIIVNLEIEKYLKANWNQEIEIIFDDRKMLVKKDKFNILGILVEYCYIDNKNNLIKDNCWIKIGTYKKYFSNSPLTVYDNWVNNKAL